MKHQLTLRRLLLYVALFAVGLGMIRFALTWGFPFSPLHSLDLLVVVISYILPAVACPLGYLIGGEEWEIRVLFIALFAGQIFVAAYVAISVIGSMII